MEDKMGHEIWGFGRKGTRKKIRPATVLRVYSITCHGSVVRDILKCCRWCREYDEVPHKRTNKSSTKNKHILTDSSKGNNFQPTSVAT